MSNTNTPVAANGREGRIDHKFARELIAFRIGEQEFCVDIMSVREIRGWTPATPLPHAPSYVNGVINLRGAVLPIVDLAARLGFQRTNPTARSVIIVTVTDDALQPTPDLASDLAKTFVRGVMAMEGRMISLIATESVLPQLQMAA